MNFQLHSRIRTGVAALGVIAGLSMPAAATPLAGASRAAIQPAAAPSVEFEQVNHRYRCYYGGCGYNYWNDDWRYRYYRPYRRHYSGLYFSFGVPGFQYYAPSYRYYDPPRRYYRRGGGHVAWCYDRYARIGNGTIPGSPITVRAGSAGRPTDDGGAKALRTGTAFGYYRRISGLTPDVNRS